MSNRLSRPEKEGDWKRREKRHGEADGVESGLVDTGGRVTRTDVETEDRAFQRTRSLE